MLGACRSQKRSCDHLKLTLQMFFSFKWVLRAEPESSAGAARDLNCCASFSPLNTVFERGPSNAVKLSSKCRSPLAPVSKD